MGKKKSSKSGKVSLTDVQSILGNVRSEIDQIKAKRDELQAELAQLDQRISHVEGAGGKATAAVPAKTTAKKTTKKTTKKKMGRPAGKATKGKGTKKKVTSRKRTGPSARSLALEILEKEKSGLLLDELASKMLASGYKSKSDNFKTVLYQTLYAMKKKGEVKYDDKERLYSV